MNTDFLKNLNNQDLIELLSSLEQLDIELSEKEGDNNE